MTGDLFPRFFLYGEPPRAVEDRFLHLEALDDRARPNNWHIRPHAHANLNHVFHITQGGGDMRADGQVIAFNAPCLLVVPSGVVHGFTYESETSGSVLTISEADLQELIGRESEFRGLFAAPAHLAIQNGGLFIEEINRLSQELAWTAPGHASAVEARLVTLFVEALRLRAFATVESRFAHGAHVALVARFRELVEANYRSGTGVEAYAETLAVSPKRLRSACLRVAGSSPLQIINDRLVLEAKRLMLYSNMTVAETAYYLGFNDPAYFSRFFRKGCGVSPRAFRSTATVAVSEQIDGGLTGIG